MTHQMLMSNEGGYTFYLYKCGKITAEYQQKIDSGQKEIRLMRGEAMLLHGVMGALSEAVEMSDYYISNIEGDWKVDNSRLMPGGREYTDSETFVTIKVE